MEGSLKLKEISYIHSEAYAAGELKHRTISFIEEGTLVASVLTQKELYKKTLSNMVEVRTRGAFVLAVTNEDNTEAEKAADYVVYIPETNRYFTNSWRSFRCSCLDTILQWEEDATWISPESGEVGDGRIVCKLAGTL